MPVAAMRIRSESFVAPLAGLGSGLAAALVFATAHALLIVPIWDRMLGGVAFAAVAGAGGGWAFGRIQAPTPRLGGMAALRRGAEFGALLWLAVAPVTLADVVLRATGVAPRYELIAVGVALVLALAGGWTLGSRLAGTRRAAIAGAVATLLLTCAMGGPVPIARNMRALGIWLAVLPACIVAGVVLASTARAWRRVDSSHPGTVVSAQA